MVENFKLTAYELKRQLKISIYLPEGYHDNDNYYPVIFALDGQIMFHSLDDNKKEFDLPSILDSCPKKCICVGIHSPANDLWRKSELLPFYNKENSEIDSSLAINFSNYLVEKLYPLIKERYRITDDTYLLGFAEGAMLALYLLYHYDLFKGAGIFSPSVNFCSGHIEDLINNFNNKKLVYLFYGGNTEYEDLYYKLYKAFYDLKCSNLIVEYSEDEINDYLCWMTHINDFINFMLP